MAKNIIKLTESELRKMITEAVASSMDQEMEYRKFCQEQKTVLEQLVRILNRSGIETATVDEYRSGLPCIAISTDEYNRSNAYEIARKFAESRRMYVTDQSYPATTYLRLDKLYY